MRQCSNHRLCKLSPLFLTGGQITKAVLLHTRHWMGMLRQCFPMPMLARRKQVGSHDLSTFYSCLCVQPWLAVHSYRQYDFLCLFCNLFWGCSHHTNGFLGAFLGLFTAFPFLRVLHHILVQLQYTCCIMCLSLRAQMVGESKPCMLCHRTGLVIQTSVIAMTNAIAESVCILTERAILI